MMRILLSLLVLLACMDASAQKSQPNYFVVLYTVGERWDTAKPYHEQNYFEEHSKHLSTLRKNKVIVLGARYSDTGLIVLAAKDEVEAKEIINKDVAIQNKLFKAEVFPFDPFYGGCIIETR